MGQEGYDDVGDKVADNLSDTLYLLVSPTFTIDATIYNCAQIYNCSFTRDRIFLGSSLNLSFAHLDLCIDILSYHKIVFLLLPLDF